jgi:hypothetical protein
VQKAAVLGYYQHLQVLAKHSVAEGGYQKQRVCMGSAVCRAMPAGGTCRSLNVFAAQDTANVLNYLGKPSDDPEVLCLLLSQTNQRLLSRCLEYKPWRRLMQG